jgi:hypothetical protein
MVIGIAASQNRRSNPETESSHAAEIQDATSTELRIRMLIQRIIFCTTVLLSHTRHFTWNSRARLFQDKGSPEVQTPSTDALVGRFTGMS